MSDHDQPSPVAAGNSEPSLEWLIARIAWGDRHAFESVYRRTSPKLDAGDRTSAEARSASEPVPDRPTYGSGADGPHRRSIGATTIRSPSRLRTISDVSCCAVFPMRMRACTRKRSDR